MATFLTTLDAVCTQLSRDARVVITQDEPTEDNETDISFSQVDSQRLKAEQEILMNLSRFYTLPLALNKQGTISILSEMATQLAAYKCWLVIHPTQTREAFPVAVTEWKKYVDGMLEKIVPEGKTSALAGRDIILEGETLNTSAGTSGEAAVAFTRFLPAGGAE